MVIYFSSISLQIFVPTEMQITYDWVIFKNVYGVSYMLEVVSI